MAKTAQGAALKRTESVVQAAEAQVREASARKAYAENQANRYEQLLQARTASEEAVEGKRQERQVTEAGLAAARANLDAARQELAQQDKFTLKLVNDQVDTCADALYQAICQRIGAAE